MEFHQGMEQADIATALAVGFIADFTISLARTLMKTRRITNAMIDRD
jgi:hypothetical protein